LLGDPNRVLYAEGLAYSRSKDKAGFSKAVEQARKADAVLVFVGEEAILSGEAHSRAHLDLPGVQDDLIDELAATGKPIVLIVMAGRPLTIGPVIEKAQAVLYAWHPGTMGGPALVDLIFGVRSPSGRLPVTFPKTEGQIPIYYSHKNTGRPPQTRKLLQMDEVPVRAYQSAAGDASRYLDVGYLPLYPFGYGLSYTEFKYSNLRLSSNRVKVGDTVKVSVDLTNAGSVEAAEVMQLYVRDMVASLTRPVKELKGFQKVQLAPQQTKTVTFDLAIKTLGFHNAKMQYVVEPGLFHLWVAGDSQSPGVEAEFEVVEASSRR
jgi:beta-glucosidase